MRKKYLSALLFGALLFASAGTFTSCKDYDDDINNLQEQINTINTTLEELTSKINGLGAGVTDFKYENGKLVIVTDKGTNFEVTLPEADGIKELEIKDGILYADGVAVGAVAGEGGAVSVEVKDGVLYINGEAQELNDEVGSKVVVVDNGNGTYTLTVDGASYVLPKASASVGVAFVNPAKTSFINLSGQQIDSDENEYGIVWGTADKYRGNWGGLKPVAKGNLLVGQISTVQVKVSAATFDLSTAKLTLVNTLGEEAPVTVTPVAEGKQGPATGSRAADAQGVWNLNIEMKPSVTAENIDVAFAAKNYNTQYDYANVKYALAVDGRVVTDYNIVVDTQTGKATSDYTFEDNTKRTTELYFVKYGVKNTIKSLIALDPADEDAATSAEVELPIGETTALCLGAINDKNAVDYVYDSYIEVCNEDLAEEYGVTANGMEITVSEDAAAKTGLPVMIHILDVNGNEFKAKKINLKFAASKDTGAALEDQQYTVMPSVDADKQFILVDLGNTFTGLTAAQANAISTANAKTGSVTLYSTKTNKLFALDGSQFEDMQPIEDMENVKFYESKEDALAYGLDKDGETKADISFTNSTVDVNASTIRKIRYAVISVDALQKEAVPNVKVPFTIILRDRDNNEVKRASAHYTVNLPSFDDVLVANDNKVWKGDTFYTRISADGSKNATISLVQPFKSKVAEDQLGYLDLNDADENLSYELKYTDVDKKDNYLPIDMGDKSYTINSADVAKFIDKDQNLLHNIDVEATLHVFGNKFTNFKVTKEFKVYLQSIFEGSTVSYYVKGKEVTGAMTLEDYQYVYGGYEVAGEKGGLFMNFDGEAQPFNFQASGKENIIFTRGYQVGRGGVSIDKPSSSEMVGAGTANAARFYIYRADGASGTLADGTDYTYTDGKTVTTLSVTLEGKTTGQLIFSFVDVMGVKVDAPLDYQKNAPETAE